MHEETFHNMYYSTNIVQLPND